MRKLDRSLHQVHSKRLHNDTHVPCSLQSPHSKGIGMITSIWNCPWTVRYTIRVSLHPYHLVMSMTESCRWVMQCRLRARRPRASNKGLRPFPLRTEISPVSLKLLLMLCTRWWDLQSLCNLMLRNVVFKVFHHLFTHSFTDWRASAHLYFWETLPL